MTYKVEPRQLRKDEIAIVPFDDNIYFVIRLDQDNNQEGFEQMYKVQVWNKETNGYGETTYNLLYWQARKRLAYLIGV